MRARQVVPLDPECPENAEYFQTLVGDPMSRHAPIGEIMEAFEARHRQECKRCQEYGAANIEIEYA